MSKDRSIYVNVFTFLDFMWSLGALPDGKFTTHIILLKSNHIFCTRISRSLYFGMCMLNPNELTTKP